MVFDSILTGMFASVLNLNFALAEFVLASVIVFVITIIYRFLIDQNKAKEMKAQITEMQKKMGEVKDNKEESNKITAEMLKLTNQQMRNSFKPLIVVMIVAFIFLPWMASVFAQQVVHLPFSIPFLGSSFGWLAWYIIVSVPLSMLFRRVLGVVS